MKNLLFPALCAFIFFSSPVSAQISIVSGKADTATPVDAEKASFTSPQTATNDPLKAKIYTLSNGLKVYLSVYKNAPRIQTYIAVKAGSKNDPANATGLAHYLEHMVFKGTDKYGTRDFEKEKVELDKIETLYEEYRKTSDEIARKNIYHQIDSISGVAATYAIANEYDKMLAEIGADGTNAFTSFDQTVYVNDIPSNQTENWLKIEAERFRKPVLRLFHTELEAVYEEKNRSLDSDNSKIWEAIFASLFRRHTYGTQTTIGTIEHLKNPSMVEIRKYYEKYYVPNNMAIIMSGDFDADRVISQIQKYFGDMPQGKAETFSYGQENPLRVKAKTEINGPDPASVSLAWRLGGEGTADADMGMLLSGILFNSTAGLFDLNLNQAQKVLGSSCFYYPMKDYGLFACSAEPKNNQTLEEAEQLMYSEIERVKRGDFPDWLLAAVVTDLKLKKIRELEKNSSRADIMLTAFVNDIPWQHHVNMIDRISKITKAQLVTFVKNNFSEKYAVAYKRTGEDKSITKVEKPAITPVELDRENSSPFAAAITESKPTDIEPAFINFDKDISRGIMKSGIPLLHSKNTENQIFELYYRFEMGSNNSKLLPVVVKYIPYLSTNDKTAAEIQQELYRLGCSFNVFCGQENVWVSLTGLNENFERAVSLFEEVLAAPVVEQNVLSNLIGDIIKERSDKKLQKRIILGQALTNYARFGPVNPFSYVLSDDELKKISTEEIRSGIAGLLSHEHRVLYYGPETVASVTAKLNLLHRVPELLKPVPPARPFPELPLEKVVYMVDYDMTQAEIVMLSNGSGYDPALVPMVTLYNSYFGGGMSSVLFQELRESRALAYSTFSRYNKPNKLTKKYFNYSYIGSQSDKLAEAIGGLNELLNELPLAENSFAASREMILQEMRTQRIMRSDVLFKFLEAEDLGDKYDIRKDIFQKVNNYTFEDVREFHSRYIKGKPATVLVLGKKESLDKEVLSAYGKVQILSLTEVFGY